MLSDNPDIIAQGLALFPLMDEATHPELIIPFYALCREHAIAPLPAVRLIPYDIMTVKAHPDHGTIIIGKANLTTLTLERVLN